MNFSQINGVLAVHELHVWQLAGDRIIASAHIRCLNLKDYMRIAEKVKEFFHNEGIHSTTIQPEFVDPSPGVSCLLLIQFCLIINCTFRVVPVTRRARKLRPRLSRKHDLCRSNMLWSQKRDTQTEYTQWNV